MSPAIPCFLPGSMSASIIASVREYPARAAAGLRGHRRVIWQLLLDPEAARRTHARAPGSLTLKMGSPRAALPSQGSCSRTPSGRHLRSSTLQPGVRTLKPAPEEGTDTTRSFPKQEAWHASSPLPEATHSH